MLLNGAAWFVAPDVMKGIGLDPHMTNNHIKPLHADERRLETRATMPNLFPLGRGSSRLTLISESGL